MGLVRFNPAFVDRAFNEFFTNTAARPAARFNRPAVNVREDADGFQLEIAAPGFAKDSFKIEVDNGLLTISAERPADGDTENKKDGYSRREFRYGTFKRSFTLPESADENAISATYTSGILNVVLPKKEEAKPQPARLIEIG